MMPDGCDADISFLAPGSTLRNVCPLSCEDCSPPAPEPEPAPDTSPHTMCFPGAFHASNSTENSTCTDDPDGHLAVVGGCGPAIFELGCDYDVVDGFLPQLPIGTLLRHICKWSCGGCEVNASFEFFPGGSVLDKLVVTDHHFRARGLRDQRTVIHGAKFSNLVVPAECPVPTEQGFRQGATCNGGALFAKPMMAGGYQSPGVWKGDTIVEVSWSKFMHNSACANGVEYVGQNHQYLYCSSGICLCNNTDMPCGDCPPPADSAATIPCRRTRVCESGKGGAIYAEGVFLTVRNSEFESNTASAGGGGGIYIQQLLDMDTTLDIVSSRFVDSDIATSNADVTVASTLIATTRALDHFLLSVFHSQGWKPEYLLGPIVTITNVTLRSATSLAVGLLQYEGTKGAKVSDTTFAPFTNGISVIMSTLGGCQQHPCEPGHACEYTDYSLSCTRCPPPNVGLDGLSCLPCPAGTGPSADATRCDRCSGNSASSTGTCLPCPAGTAVDEDRYRCNDVSLPDGDVSDPSVALQVLRSTNLLPQTTFQLEVDDVNAVTGPGAARDALKTNLQTDIAESLGIDISVIEVSGIRPLKVAGRRALQTGASGANVAFDLKFILMAAATSVQHIEDIKEQLLDPASALRTSSTAGRIDATVGPRFSFVCPAGLMRELGASACISCTDRSTYTDDGQTCKPCPNNQAPNSVGDGCTCKDNFYDSSAGRVVCYAVGEDFEQSDLHNVGAVSENDRCQLCGHCVTCNVGVAILNRGFAVSETVRLALPATQVALRAPVAVFACPLDGCPGQASPSSNETQACSTGFTAGLCSVCDGEAGYVRDGTVCTHCDTGSSITVLAPVLGTLLIAGIVYQQTAKCREKRAAASEAASAPAGVVTFVGGLMIQIKILIGLMQITTQLPVTLTIRYPDVFARLLKVIGIVLLDIFDVFRIDCLSPLSLHAKFVIIMLLPVVGIAFVQILRCVSNRGATPEQAATNHARAAYRSFFVIFLLYPLLSRTTFSIFRCQTLATGERWHEEDFSIDCDSTAHTVIVVVDMFCILIYPVGIPVVFLVLLWRDERSRNLKAPETVEQAAITTNEDEVVAMVAPAAANASSSYDFLRQDYTPKYYYYEIVVLSEKLLLTGLLIFVDQGSVFQAFVGGCVAFVFFAVQVKCEPFVNPIDNLLKAAAEAQLFLTLFISVVLRTDLGKDALSEDAYGGILVAALFAAPSIELLFGFKRLLCHISKSDLSPTLTPSDGAGTKPADVAEKQP
jgi:hypothetical protein